MRTKTLRCSLLPFVGAVFVIVCMGIRDDVRTYNFVHNLKRNETLSSKKVQSKLLFGHVITTKTFFRNPAAEHLIRSITVPIAHHIYPYVTANQVTAAAVVAAIVSLQFFKSKNAATRWVGFGLIVLREFLDCTDGEVARARQAQLLHSSSSSSASSSSSSSASSSSSSSASSSSSSHTVISRTYAYFLDGICDSVFIFVFLYACHLKWRENGTDGRGGGAGGGGGRSGGGSDDKFNLSDENDDDYDDDYDDDDEVSPEVGGGVGAVEEGVRVAEAIAQVEKVGGDEDISRNLQVSLGRHPADVDHDRDGDQYSPLKPLLQDDRPPLHSSSGADHSIAPSKEQQQQQHHQQGHKQHHQHHPPPPKLPPYLPSSADSSSRKKSSSAANRRRFEMKSDLLCRHRLCRRILFPPPRQHWAVLCEYLIVFLFQSYCYNKMLVLYSRLLEGRLAPAETAGETPSDETMVERIMGAGSLGSPGNPGNPFGASTGMLTPTSTTTSMMMMTTTSTTTSTMIIQSPAFCVITHLWMLIDPTVVFLAAAFSLCVNKEYQFCRFSSRRLVIFVVIMFIISLIHLHQFGNLM